MSAIYCRKVGGEFRLNASLDKVCSSDPLWIVHNYIGLNRIGRNYRSAAAIPFGSSTTIQASTI